jgi:hypothetical protein
MLANEFASIAAERTAIEEQVSAVLKGWLTRKRLP